MVDHRGVELARPCLGRRLVQIPYLGLLSLVLAALLVTTALVKLMNGR